MDNAKRMREERKTGSVLKSVGEQFVLKSPAPQNQKPDQTSTSGFSQGGTNYRTPGGNLQTASTSVSNGFGGVQKYQQDNQTINSQQYIGGNG